MNILHKITSIGFIRNNSNQEISTQAKNGLQTPIPPSWECNKTYWEEKNGFISDPKEILISI
jgi:hypothetical protein